MSTPSSTLARHGHDGDAVFSRFDGHTARRIAGFLAPHRAALAAAILSILAYTAVQVAIPATVRLAVDSVVGASAHALSSVLLVFAGLVAANAVLGFLQEWIAARLAQRAIFDLRRAMYAHLQDVSLSVLDQTQTGRLMSRLQGDVNALQEFLENSVLAIGDLFLLAGIVFVLVAMDWQLGLLTLAVLPALVVVRARWIPWARKVFIRAREASSAVNAALAENINGIRTVQENRREAENLRRYGVLARENLTAQLGSARASQLMVPLVDVLTGIALAVVVVVGGSHVIDGSLGVGVMVAFIFYVQRFFEPIRTLSMQYTVMQRAMAAGHRIFEVLDVPLTLQDRPDALSPAHLTPAISLRNVTFGYRPGHPVLRGLDLEIAPFTTVALVGPTGSGKTSIAALVHRFYDVWEGSVSIGGHDVRDLTLATLGRTVGMVQQEPFLFSGTVADNIRYGVEGATREEIEAAARAVHAHDFIARLPQGYDTPLGQRARNLSIGQRQLLSFARTLLANPPVLILDEATANIDSFTERDIQRALKVLCAGRTTIVIAHRLSTVRDADRIVVLGDGRVAEQGTHAELLALGGAYARLHASRQDTVDAAAH
ncbi:ABC transporter ATP-binding protein [Xylophilus sp.]|uniref:ABC transporter ATP-binding protein n=1 Tax=Xylophilus sp. TaxID=2653893 RepID=UPI0013B94DEA|nr:ABC transporter ATP-binding protein [Xylophilus sp.]KAF1046645.1 MAG: putative ABC transporter ATP-binding protein [Xylophilus sp.]